MSQGPFPNEKISPSISAPFQMAIDWVKSCLFPFNFNTWLVFAVAAFLASLGEGGGGTTYTGNWRGGGPAGPGTANIEDQISRGMEFLDKNAAIFLLSAIGILLLIYGLITLFLWIGSRGKFIYLDSVLRGSPSIVEPWSRLASLGNSLFKFRLLIFTIFYVLAFPFFLGLIYSFGRRIQAGENLEESLFKMGIPFVIGVIFFALLGLAWKIFMVFIVDFVIPIMHRRGIMIVPAIKTFWSLFTEYLGGFLIYLLVRFLISMGIGIIMGILGCILCCIMCIPVINLMPFLPFLIFLRAFPIFYLEQFGPNWEIFDRAAWNRGLQISGPESEGYGGYQGGQYPPSDQGGTPYPQYPPDQGPQ